MLGMLNPCKGGDPIPLAKKKMVIGRKSFCDIPLQFANVSSRHCELEYRDGFWYVQDLDSTNGTSIDGRGCQNECVRPGSVLGIGRHRFTLEYKAEGEPPNELTVSDVVASSLSDKAGFEPDEPPSASEPGAPAGSPNNRNLLLPVGGGTPIVLSGEHLVVCRDRGCDLRFPVSSVSARHCELEFSEGHWLVRDLGSRNGTKVDGKQVEQKWLFPKCELQISNLRFKVMYTPTPGSPPPKDQAVSFTRSLLERAGLKRRR